MHLMDVGCEKFSGRPETKASHSELIRVSPPDDDGNGTHVMLFPKLITVSVRLRSYMDTLTRCQYKPWVQRIGSRDVTGSHRQSGK